MAGGGGGGVAVLTGVSVGGTDVTVGDGGIGVGVSVAVGKGVDVNVGISVAVGVGVKVGAGDDSTRAKILVGWEAILSPAASLELNHNVKPDPTPASDNRTQIVRKRKPVTATTMIKCCLFKRANLSQLYFLKADHGSRDFWHRQISGAAAGKLCFHALGL